MEGALVISTNSDTPKPLVVLQTILETVREIPVHVLQYTDVAHVSLSTSFHRRTSHSFGLGAVVQAFRPQTLD